MKRHLFTILAVAILAVGPAFAADSPGEVLKSYRAAHEANSIERVEQLVHFRTQDASRRASWLKEIAGTFSSKIAKISLIPFSESAFMLPESELKKLPTSLKPTNWLALEFAADSDDQGRTVTTHYLVASEDGKYFIVGP